jgi:hypothetical protein
VIAWVLDRWMWTITYLAFLAWLAWQVERVT